MLLAPITFVHSNMGFIGLKAFPAAVVGGFGSLPGAIVGGLIIGVVEALAGFYLPRGLQGHRGLRRGAGRADVQPNGSSATEAAQEGLRGGTRCASIFKTDYAQDIRLFQHGGQVFWYGLLALAAARRAVAAPRVLRSAQLTLHPHLRASSASG